MKSDRKIPQSEGLLRSVMHAVGRREPLRATGRFATIYFALPFLAIKSIFYVYYSIIRAREQYVYGETDKQYKNRKLVEIQCAKIEETTPNNFGLSAFTNEQQEILYTCKEECDRVKQSYALIRETMQQRRRTSMGDQEVFCIDYISNDPSEISLKLLHANTKRMRTFFGQPSHPNPFVLELGKIPDEAIPYSYSFLKAKT